MAGFTLIRGMRHAGTPLVLAIGNFDGVHRGHQALLARAVERAGSLGSAPAAMSFSPLPREYFQRLRGQPAPPRLMSVTEKLAAFRRAGLTHAFLPRFDARFAALTAGGFAESLARMGVRAVIAGADFRFGAGRQGDMDFLAREGGRLGFAVEAMPDVCSEGARVSSSAIRGALWNGRLAEAAHLLGRPYTVVGRVTHGRKLGGTIGFPTANIALTGRTPALHGVFAVECRLVTRGLEGVAGMTGSMLGGVANLGTNPVVSSENRQHLEVFLFDFTGDLYGQRIACAFIEKIRDEQNFDGLAALSAQIRDDAARARHLLRMSDGPENRLQKHP